MSAVNTTLLAAGAALVASPILIHLLSRRKFRTVHWAAMDFLLTADKKNRRRVQLENLLLMLLRCVIILLIALLVARPFQRSSAITLFVGLNEGIERIVILDDSPSMAVGEAFEKARARLIQFVEGVAKDRGQDSITVYVTSDPENPYGGIHKQKLETENVAKLVVSKIAGIPVSAQVADLGRACDAVKDSIAGDADDKNRTVYIFSDMRRRDWDSASDENRSADQLAEKIKSLAVVATDLYIVDVATDERFANLSVADVASSEQSLVAGVATTIRATILNTSPTDAAKVAVRLAVDGTVTQKKTIPTIPAGESRSVEFPYTFLADAPARVRVEIDGDALRADDERFFAAQVRRATEVLIVQEDTVYDNRRDEPSYFLHRVLKPGDDYASGFAVEEATETELDSVDLDKYDVVFLCNLPSLSASQTKRLEDWVRGGGGLFVALGDAVNKQAYNMLLYKGGKGLLPVKLVDPTGFSDHSEWAHLEATKPTHPAVDIYSGETEILARQVKIFEWWKTEANRKDIVANLTDLDEMPLLVEKRFGKGHVSVWTTSINDAWNNIPLDDSFAWVMARNTEHIRRTRSELTTQDVGRPIQYDFDAARYRLSVRLTAPDGENTQVDVEELKAEKKTEQKKESVETPANPQHANPTASKSTSATANENGEKKDEPQKDIVEIGDKALKIELEGEPEPLLKETLAADQLKTPYRAFYTNTGKRGFYELTLKGFDDEAHTVLFARNIDATEGQLARADRDELASKLSDNERIHLIQEAGNLSLDASGTRQSYWRHVLIVLLVALAVEQSLAWYFGTKR